MRILILGLCLSIALVGCKESETDKVADAQFCIDQATAANVNECVAKVDGIETRAANIIRCTAKFVEQSYTEGDRIIVALEQLNGAGTGGDQSAAVMSVLAFTAAGTSTQAEWDANLADAQEAVTLCQKAELSALINIASYASIATVAGPFLALGDSLTNPDDLQAALLAASSNPAAQAVIGNAALASYNENCTATTEAAPGEFCAQFEAAIAAGGGTSNPAGVGAIIAQCYGNPSAPGCEAYN